MPSCFGTVEDVGIALLGQKEDLRLSLSLSLLLLLPELGPALRSPSKETLRRPSAAILQDSRRIPIMKNPQNLSMMLVMVQDTGSERWPVISVITDDELPGCCHGWCGRLMVCFHGCRKLYVLIGREKISQAIADV